MSASFCLCRPAMLNHLKRRSKNNFSNFAIAQVLLNMMRSAKFSFLHFPRVIMGSSSLVVPKRTWSSWFLTPRQAEHLVKTPLVGFKCGDHHLAAYRWNIYIVYIIYIFTFAHVGNHNYNIFGVYRWILTQVEIMTAEIVCNKCCQPGSEVRKFCKKKAIPSLMFSLDSYKLTVARLFSKDRQTEHPWVWICSKLRGS